jgi:CubicO group peptidase (beta-lactamase class C family)
MAKINQSNARRDIIGRFFGRLIVILLCCWLVTALIYPGQAAARRTGADFSSVDAYMEGQMKDLHIPGAALVIVQGDQVAYVQGYGKTGPGKGSVTPQTSFMIGSTTKAFTALAVMQLVEADKIELEVPVQTYLPWFRATDPNASAQITVRHLLNQTSGFSNAAGVKEELAHDLSDIAIEASVRRLAEVNLRRTPGEAHEYSNLNFNILGLIVQTVSG